MYRLLPLLSVGLTVGAVICYRKVRGLLAIGGAFKQNSL